MKLGQASKLFLPKLLSLTYYIFFPNDDCDVVLPPGTSVKTHYWEFREIKSPEPSGIETHTLLIALPRCSSSCRWVLKNLRFDLPSSSFLAQQEVAGLAQISPPTSFFIFKFSLSKSHQSPKFHESRLSSERSMPRRGKWTCSFWLFFLKTLSHYFLRKTQSESKSCDPWFFYCAINRDVSQLRVTKLVKNSVMCNCSRKQKRHECEADTLFKSGYYLVNYFFLLSVMLEHFHWSLVKPSWILIFYSMFWMNCGWIICDYSSLSI